MLHSLVNMFRIESKRNRKKKNAEKFGAPVFASPQEQANPAFPTGQACNMEQCAPRDLVVGSSVIKVETSSFERNSFRKTSTAQVALRSRPIPAPSSLRYGMADRSFYSVVVHQMISPDVVSTFVACEKSATRSRSLGSVRRS